MKGALGRSLLFRKRKADTLTDKYKRLVGAIGASLIILGAVLCGFAFQDDDSPGLLILGWSVVSFLQAVEKYQDGESIVRVLIQIPFWSGLTLLLFGYALKPRRWVLTLSLGTLVAYLVAGGLLTWLAVVVSDWDFM
jgi:hypothetical protein